MATSILPPHPTYTGASVPWRESSRVSLWAHGLGCRRRLDRLMVNVPPTLTAGAPYLGALPIPLMNLMSPEREAAPWPRPPRLSLPAPASTFLCASFSLPCFLSGSPPTPVPSLSLTAPPGALGLGDGAAHTSRSHCSTICFCLHLVGRRQERSERLMRHCERAAAGGRASVVTGN